MADEVDPDQSEVDEYEWEMSVGFCSICDALGHGYPGGSPCPLEMGRDDGFEEWERRNGVLDFSEAWDLAEPGRHRADAQA